MNEGIYFLKKDDFVLKDNIKGKLLGLAQPKKGLELILFYSKECKYCDKLLAQYKQLPNIIFGCKFGLLNINHHHEVVEMSKNTISPITYVPDLILYVNGLPYIRYDGPSEKDAIKDFIVDIHKKLSNVPNVQQNDGAAKPVEAMNNSFVKEDKIPEYTIGKPLCGSGRDQYGKCYVNFDNAYGSN